MISVLAKWLAEVEGKSKEKLSTARMTVRCCPVLVGHGAAFISLSTPQKHIGGIGLT
jgi:hypothetical protein